MSFVQSFLGMRAALAEQGGAKFRVKRPARQRGPRGIERAFAADVVRLITAIRDDIEEFLIPEIGRLSRESELRGDADHLDIDDISATMDRISATLTVRLDNKHLRDLEQLVTDYFNRTSVWDIRQLRRQLRRMLGVDAFPSTPQGQVLLNTFVKENVELIKSLGGNYVTEVGNIVRRRVRAGDRPAVIAEDIRDRFRVSKNKAKLIARDQTNKINGALNRMRQTSLGIEEYIWRTSRDERVRTSHLELEGRKFRWDDPPAIGHPGQPIQCRCTAEPVIEGEPPPKEDRRKVIREVKAKRKQLRKKLKGRKAARLIAR